MRGAVLAGALTSVLMGISAPGLLAGQQAPAAERKLEISFDMAGRVTLVAENVTLREVLAEWGRVGGSSMINANRLAGATIPALRFDNRPEREVLDSLLRSAAGYILGPRTVRTSGPSLYEAVMILPTSSPVASSSYAGAPPTSQYRTAGAPEDEIPPVVPAVGVPVPGQPAAEAPPAPPRNTNPGVYVPIVPVQPVTPVQPPAGRGRGGGGGR